MFADAAFDPRSSSNCEDAWMLVSLHSRTGGPADNIIRVYNFSNATALLPLKNQSVNGRWKLRVSDVVGQDVGKLNKWSIKIIKQ